MLWVRLIFLERFVCAIKNYIVCQHLSMFCIGYQSLSYCYTYACRNRMRTKDAIAVAVVTSSARAIVGTTN